nr:divergent polysaccharide deacetylase family protein [Govania unica]
MPKIGSDGREPWQVYSRPYEDKTARPRIAIVITGLGLSKLVTETAITTLPPAVSLAFSPYGEGLVARSRRAREAGHELLLMLPMEPQDYPKNDPGPHSLLTSLPAAENIARMHWVMSRFPGYVGVVNEMGSKFSASEEAMTPVLKELKSRGLLFMDSRSSQYSVAGKLARTLRVPRAINNRYIDEQPSEDQIRKQLDDIENLARSYGAAAAIGRAHPVTMRTVAAWAAGLEKRGFELVPLTAVVNRQPVR